MTTRTAPIFDRSDFILFGISAALIAATAFCHFSGMGGAVVAFLASAAAVALLAALVGRSVEQLGDRFGPGGTGVLQSALGNLPELFIALFALKAGLVDVVKAALIGSMLANLLLVLGLAFVVGGLKHGVQALDSGRARTTIMLLVLSVAALVLPSLASYIHTPAEPHEGTLSIAVSAVLLAMFALSLPASIRLGQTDHAATRQGSPPIPEHDPPRWPVAVAVGVLATASIAAAFVSDWFVDALQPAMQTLHISQAFAGLVIVAIAGNAIENVVGIQLAARNQSRYAFAVIINSPLQIALVLAPLLVIASQLFGLGGLTLVFPPMLVASTILAVAVIAFVTFDGQSDWLEGAGLIAVYAIIAMAFWWG